MSKPSLELRVAVWISVILRTGVILSSALSLIGLSICFLHHPEYSTSEKELARLVNPGAAFPHTITDVTDGVMAGRGQAIIMLGLLTLIATPILRVAVSIAAFFLEGDRTFLIITTIVLLILLLSFWFGANGA